MRTTVAIGIEWLKKRLQMPEEWEIITWECDGHLLNNIKLFVSIDPTDMPISIRKLRVSVDNNSTDDDPPNWCVRVMGPARQDTFLGFRTEEMVPYNKWKQDMIDGSRCEKCFWLLETGFGNRVVPYCVVCDGGG